MRHYTQGEVQHVISNALHVACIFNGDMTLRSRLVTRNTLFSSALQRLCGTQEPIRYIRIDTKRLPTQENSAPRQQYVIRSQH